MDDDYEILPHKDIENLKSELKKLKGGDYDSSLGSSNSMDNLQLSIHNLLDIFKEAGKNLEEDHDHHSEMEKKLDHVVEKISTVLEQNEKIAEGIVAVADMLKELKGTPDMPKMPSFHQESTDLTMGSPSGMPKPSMPTPPSPMEAPSMPKPPSLAPTALTPTDSPPPPPPNIAPMSSSPMPPPKKAMM